MSFGDEAIFDKLFLKGMRPYLWIAAVIVMLYSKSLWYGYTYLDDNILIMRNIEFLKDLSNIWSAFWIKVFPKSYLPYYRPLLTISLMLDAQFAENSLLFYHITNIAIHIAASCLLFLFLKNLGYGRELSFFFSVIFAVHPALSQGVAWLPGRNDTMLAVFVLASTIFFIVFLRNRKQVSYAAHMFFFALALFTKETALVLAPLSLLYMRLVAKESLFSRRTVALISGWTGIGIVWFLFREQAVQNSKVMNFYEMGSLIAAYLPAVLQFLGKVFFPFNLSVFPIIADTTMAYGIAAAALLAAAVFMSRHGRKDMMIFGAAWAVMFLLPSLIRANTRLVADFLEHRLYVPIIGCIVILCETDTVAFLDKHKMLMRSCALIVIALFSFLTFRHMDNFADKFAFWRNAVRTSPRSSFAHLALAIAYADDGMGEEAESEYRKCLQLDPLEPGAIYGLGAIYYSKGMISEAERQMKKTIAAYPGYDIAHLELGVIYYKTGRLKEAENMWNKAVSINPANVHAYKNLAIYYYEQKRFDKAAYCVRRLKEMGFRVPNNFIELLAQEGVTGLK
ncbi:MAG: tetratricopeptide repeat protein [Candidatus Omnitrophica bacterium]|nr:tetratricopeptide repeat protein [Candidatus Omnitrophota bacterium]MCM8790877.1 tetratricopeptide repeat protein [Candidatus Omnitrophota bacterium]